jgi:hypothetical protein
VTRDTDICYERSPENLERLAEALEDLGARLRGVDEDVPFLLHAKTLGAGDHFMFRTRAVTSTSSARPRVYTVSMSWRSARRRSISTGSPSSSPRSTT